MKQKCKTGIYVLAIYHKMFNKQTQTLILASIYKETKLYPRKLQPKYVHRRVTLTMENDKNSRILGQLKFRRELQGLNRLTVGNE